MKPNDHEFFVRQFPDFVHLKRKSLYKCWSNSFQENFKYSKYDAAGKHESFSTHKMLTARELQNYGQKNKVSQRSTVFSKTARDELKSLRRRKLRTFLEKGAHETQVIGPYLRIKLLFPMIFTPTT